MPLNWGKSLFVRAPTMVSSVPRRSLRDQLATVTSTINQARKANLNELSLSIGSLQKKKVMSVSAKRTSVLDDVVCFHILKTYQNK
jgi:hypothetical protein